MHSAFPNPLMLYRRGSRSFRALIYSHAVKLEGMESFQLVLNSLKGELRVDLLIITSLVGRIDGTSAAGAVCQYLCSF